MKLSLETPQSFALLIVTLLCFLSSAQAEDKILHKFSANITVQMVSDDKRHRKEIDPSNWSDYLKGNGKKN